MTRLADIAVRALKAVEGQERLDVPSYKLEHGFALTLNLLGDATEPVRNALHGVWLGHPLHPALTDIPMGAWTTAAVLDAVDLVSPRPAGFRTAAQTSIGLGIVGAVGAAVTGLTDWQYTHDQARRSGLVHGALNTAALGFYTASWLDRRRGRDGRARITSGFGYLIAQAGAYIGGDLVSRHRIGVDHADEQLAPRTFTVALSEGDLTEGEPRRVDVDGVPIVLVRSKGRIHALGQHCPHLGGPLAEGWLYRDSIVCPWHGSRFDLDTGRNVSGPATIATPLFDTRVVDGQIEVRRRVLVPRGTPGSVVAREQERADAGH